MSKFLRSASGESSNSSSDEVQSSMSNAQSQESEGETLDVGHGTLDTAVSPLALMNANSPEAWLGQFLLQLELETRRGTLKGAKLDADLLHKLSEMRAATGANSPLQMLDAEYASRLRAENWAAWWKAQDNMSHFCYATLALSLLGSREYVADLAAMYRQDANSRIRKDAHYVLCYILGKPWPGYEVTEGDLARLQDGR